MTVHRVRWVARVVDDLDLLQAREPLDHRRILRLVLESGLELVVAQVLGDRAAVEVALEVLLLNQAEAARLHVVRARPGVDVLDSRPGDRRGSDRIALRVNGVLGGHHPGRSKDAVVSRDPILAAKVLPAEKGRERAVQGMGPVVDSARLRRGILKEAAHQRVRRVDHQCQLRGSEVLHAGALHEVALARAGRELIGDIALHAVVGDEEPDAVLPRIPAQVRASVVARESLVRPVEILGGVLVARLERVRVVVTKDVAVVLVAARLCDDVDDAARGPTEFGLVASGLDLDLLDELVVEVRSLRAVLDARRVRSVEDEAVLQPGRAVDRDRAGEVVGVRGLGGHAGRDQNDGREVAAGRQRADLAVVEIRPGGHRGRVHGRRLPGNDHLRLERRPEPEIERRRLRERDGHRLLRSRETLERNGYLVNAGRQKDEAVGAGSFGDGSPRPRERGAAALHRDAGNRTALLVRDVPDDVAGGLGEGEGGGDGQKNEESHGGESAHGTSSKI